MPKKAKELTALDVRRIKHPGVGRNVTVAVGGVDGLLLQVTPSGARSWLLRYLSAGKRRHLGLGPYPDVSLSSARERAREAREQLWQGTDPIEARKATRAELAAAQQRGLTFSQAFERYADEKTKEFSSEKYRRQWRRTVEQYAVPHIGGLLVSNITLQDILRVLQPIWESKTVTAKKLRQRVERILDYATVSGHREGSNPAAWKGNLDHVLPAPGKVSKSENWPALQLDDAAEWFTDLRKREGMATRALEFLALTASRSGEVRGMVWSEVDIEKRVWIISAKRMKADREHRVPLNDRATALLQSLDRFEGVDLVFPAARMGPLSDAGMSAGMRRINAARAGGYKDRETGKPAVVHGLRSTFRDWVAERTEYPREMAEIALAHKVGSEVERAYRRSDMIERRRAMMDEWAKFLEAEQ